MRWLAGWRRVVWICWAWPDFRDECFSSHINFISFPHAEWLRHRALENKKRKESSLAISHFITHIRTFLAFFSLDLKQRANLMNFSESRDRIIYTYIVAELYVSCSITDDRLETRLPTFHAMEFLRRISAASVAVLRCYGTERVGRCVDITWYGERVMLKFLSFLTHAVDALSVLIL